MAKDLFQVMCPKCGHSAHMHNGGHCNARWQNKQQFNRFHVCKCELSKDKVLLTVIEQLENDILAKKNSVQSAVEYNRQLAQAAT